MHCQVYRFDPEATASLVFLSLNYIAYPQLALTSNGSALHLALSTRPPYRSGLRSSRSPSFGPAGIPPHHPLQRPSS